MDKIDLTRDGDTLICLIYKEYCQRRKDGKSIEDSSYMGDDVDIVESITPKWQLDDVTHLCWYLKVKGLLNVSRGDGRANHVTLCDDGICYMENRFPKGLKQVLDAISFISGFVTPWI